MSTSLNIQFPDSISYSEDLFLFLKNNKSSPRSDSLKNKTWRNKSGKEIEWSDEMVKLAETYLIQLDWFDRTFC
jgi:hypothetical protein